jgi:hypothetical protein
MGAWLQYYQNTYEFELYRSLFFISRDAALVRHIDSNVW